MNGPVGRCLIAPRLQPRGVGRARSGKEAVDLQLPGGRRRRVGHRSDLAGDVNLAVGDGRRVELRQHSEIVARLVRRAGPDGRRQVGGIERVERSGNQVVPSRPRRRTRRRCRCRLSFRRRHCCRRCLPAVPAAPPLVPALPPVPAAPVVVPMPPASLPPRPVAMPLPALPVVRPGKKAIRRSGCTDIRGLMSAPPESGGIGIKCRRD